MWTLAKVLLVALAATYATLAVAQEPAVGDMTLGNADAPVTVIEFASMTCPHCGTFHIESFPLLKAEYIDAGLVYFEFREFPLDQLAVVAAALARCAGPDRFFPFIDTLFRQQQNWSRSEDPMQSLYQLAQIGGLPREEFDSCLADGAVTENIVNTRFEAEQQFDIRSTPSFVVNGVLVEGHLPWSEFAAILDEAAAGGAVSEPAASDRASTISDSQTGTYVAIALVIAALAIATAFFLRRRSGGGV